jgi:hypothetical protein
MANVEEIWTVEYATNPYGACFEREFSSYDEAIEFAYDVIAAGGASYQIRMNGDLAIGHDQIEMAYRQSGRKPKAVSEHEPLTDAEIKKVREYTKKDDLSLPPPMSLVWVARLIATVDKLKADLLQCEANKRWYAQLAND